MKIYTLPTGQKIPRGQQFTANDLNYPANWLEHATPLDLAEHGLSVDDVPDAAPVQTMPVVEQAAPPVPTVTFSGHVYPLPDRGFLALLLGIASTAVMHGIQANNYRWRGDDTDFTMRDIYGTDVSMDAPTLISFAIAVSKV